MAGRVAGVRFWYSVLLVNFSTDKCIGSSIHFAPLTSRYILSGCMKNVTRFEHLGIKGRIPVSEAPITEGELVLMEAHCVLGTWLRASAVFCH